ncbi:MAG: glucose-6-phosphate isomerase [Candidatus Xenobiia bacterium LiM19]
MCADRKRISLDYSKVMKYITKEDLDRIAADVLRVRAAIQSRNCLGSEYLGWIDLPARITKEEITDMAGTASVVIGNSDAFLVVGIGGSYLGTRAVLSALLPTYYNEMALICGRQIPRIYYTGCDISPQAMADLLDLIKDRRVTINIISKSGSTTEPALAFRILKNHFVKKLGREEAKRRVIATTDRTKGALKRLAEREGYKTFAIPDDVGGRFSVLTPVGLLPIAVGGVDINELVAGARDMAECCKEPDMMKNPAVMYAAIRNLLNQKGRSIEILTSFEPSLHYLGEWWKQLYGESEGKNGKGIYPDYLDFSTDLHSMGQWIQEGVRSIFETFLVVEESRATVAIPPDEQNSDNLNYLADKTLNFINSKAYEGVSAAHLEGDVPNMAIRIPRQDAYYLGQLIYFFEYGVAVSGYLLGVNPFDQPGVELYKRNMFALLGKPGFEAQGEALRKSMAAGAEHIA